MLFNPLIVSNQTDDRLTSANRPRLAEAEVAYIQEECIQEQGATTHAQKENGYSYVPIKAASLSLALNWKSVESLSIGPPGELKKGRKREKC